MTDAQAEQHRRPHRMIPSIGCIVIYTLKSTDAEAINRRRTNGPAIAERMAKTPAEWPTGAQAHIGKSVNAGDKFPMLIVRIWGAPVETAAVNGQVFLDGNDVFWANTVIQGSEAGAWAAPERTPLTDAQAERLILVLERIATAMERPYSPLRDGAVLAPYVVSSQTYNTGDTTL